MPWPMADLCNKAIGDALAYGRFMQQSHPETQKTWTGRGKPPAWIAGKDRSLFEIKA